MLNKIKNLFVKSKYKNDYEGNVYFINAGSVKGDYFVVVGKRDENNFIFFNLTPDKESVKSIDVPSDALISGLKNKIVDFVERLPYNIYEECKNEYLKNENSNSRL
jgi:hypothetical protein